MEKPTPRQQSEYDNAVIKVKLIENAVLVGAGTGWFSFPDWEKASHHVGARLKILQEQRIQNRAQEDASQVVK